MFRRMGRNTIYAPMKATFSELKDIVQVALTTIFDYSTLAGAAAHAWRD